jgi:CheY-specific phosphatase CheX
MISSQVRARVRPRFFGQYLLAKGHLTAPQLLAAVEYQEQHNTRVGDQAVAQGLLTPFDVQRVRALQTHENLFFGEAAIRLGVLTTGQVRDLLTAQKDRHVHLGDALANLGYLDRERTDRALAEFLAEEDRIEPEMVTVPEDLPSKEVAFELFHLAHRLLLRVWNLENKTDRLRIETGMVALSDRNARITISGAVETVVFVCAPHEVARMAARAPYAEEDPPDEEMNRAVREFCRVLCENLASVLAEQGLRVTVGQPQMLMSRASTPPGIKASVVAYLTHRGQVFVGMTHVASPSSRPPVP